MTIAQAVEVAKREGHKSMGETIDFCFLYDHRPGCIEELNELTNALWKLMMRKKGCPEDRTLDKTTHEWFNTFLDNTPIEEYERTDNGNDNS